MQEKESLLYQSIQNVIKENLGEIALIKIEARLSEKYQTSIPLIVEEFNKLDDVLREYFGAGAERLGKRIMDRMLAMEPIQN
ncbi:MAG: hypothetical protein ACT4N5_08325 [Nitrosopumilaceae archaeon]